MKVGAERSERRLRAKRYPYFPLPENMDTIVYHPTPVRYLSERSMCTKPRRGFVPQTRGFVQEDEPPIRHGGEARLVTKPASVALEGRGRYKMCLSAVLSMGVG